MGWHLTIATIGNGLFDNACGATIQPDIVCQVGCPHGLVTLTVRAVADGTHGIEGGLASRGLGGIGLAAANAQDIVGHIIDRLLTKVGVAGHDAHTARHDRGFNRLGCAAPQPVIICQVRKTPRTTGIRTMAGGALGQEQALACLHGLAVIGQGWHIGAGELGKHRAIGLIRVRHFPLVFTG